MSRRALFRLAVLPAACAALSAPGQAHAQAGNPANGATLYAQKLQPSLGVNLSCDDCHGSADVNRAFWGSTEDAIFNRINGAINGFNVMSAFRVWNAQQRRDVAAYVAAAAVPPPPPPPAGLPPVPTATPDSLQFPVTPPTGSSATQTVTIRNVSTTASITLGTPFLTNAGGDAVQFRLATLQAGECANGTVLAPNATCTFRVSYNPAVAGTHRGNFAVNSNGGIGQRLVVLYGSTAPAGQAVLLSPDAVTFGSTAVGTNSANAIVMVTNQSTAALTFAPTLLTMSGTHPGDFTQQAPGSGAQCAPNATLAVGATCTIAFRFQPTAAGARSAAVSLQFAGAPSRTVALQGTATAGSPPPPPGPAPSPAPAAGGGGASGPAALAGLFALLLAAGRQRRRRA